MRTLTIGSLTALSLIAFSGIAAATCFEGHVQSMASEMAKPKDGVTLSTHDGQVKLPAENAGPETAPVKTGE